MIMFTRARDCSHRNMSIPLSIVKVKMKRNGGKRTISKKTKKQESFSVLWQLNLLQQLSRGLIILAISRMLMASFLSERRKKAFLVVFFYHYYLRTRETLLFRTYCAPLVCVCISMRKPYDYFWVWVWVWLWFLPVCVRVCRANSSLRAKRLPQLSHVHGNGFSPVWVRRWAFKCELLP